MLASEIAQPEKWHSNLVNVAGSRLAKDSTPALVTPVPLKFNINCCKPSCSDADREATPTLVRRTPQTLNSSAVMPRTSSLDASAPALVSLIPVLLSMSRRSETHGMYGDIS